MKIHILTAVALRSVAIALLASASHSALAQSQPAENDNSAEEVSEGDEIIVIGTAGGGVNRQDAAFAVTNLDADAITRAAPTSTADLFKSIPGISAESSGGQNGANIFVRGYPSAGDAEFVTITTQGVPFFPAATLSFLDNSQLIRIDETLARVEAVRGGTGSLYGNGQPGVTINFVQREGGRDFEGLVKTSVTDYGDVRGDLRLSGPLGDNTTFMVGGFYNAGRGIKSQGFTVEKGGQITANVRHDLEKGSILLFGRYLNDYGQWLLPVPIVQQGNDLSQFGNIDPGTGTLGSRELRLALLPDGTRADLADGRGANLVNFGTNFDYELGEGLGLRYRASYLKGDANTTGLVPASAPVNGAAFAAGLGSTIRSLNFVNGGAAVANPNAQLVTTSGTWRVTKQIEAFTSDLGFEWKSGSNVLNVGVYYADYSSDDQWNLGNIQLLTAENNARRLDLTLTNGQLATQRGFLGGSFFNVNAAYDAREYALYASDEFTITPELKIDAGARYQNYRASGTIENNDFGVNIDGNPNTLYDNNTARLNGTFGDISYKKGAWSYTGAVNYEFTDSIAAYVRYSRGNTNPFFDNLRSGIFVSPKVDNYEAGLKLRTDPLSLYATVFKTEFDGLATTVITNGAPIASLGGGKSRGVEIEGQVRPFEGFSVGFSGTYIDAEYVNFFANGGATDLSGNRVQRQPKWAWRVQPAFEFDIAGAGKGTAFATVAYTGDRFSDVQNQQILPNFIKIDAGLTFDIGDAFLFAVTVDNLTDEIGLTEGNPRVIGSQGSGIINARPILGRSFRFTAGYRF